MIKDNFLTLQANLRRWCHRGIGSRRQDHPNPALDISTVLDFFYSAAPPRRFLIINFKVWFLNIIIYQRHSRSRRKRSLMIEFGTKRSWSRPKNWITFSLIWPRPRSIDQIKIRNLDPRKKNLIKNKKKSNDHLPTPVLGIS